MEKISPVLPEVAFSWNFGRKFNRSLHAKYSINQKIKSTIIFDMENATLYQMIIHFDFLLGTLLSVLTEQQVAFKFEVLTEKLNFALQMVK